MSIPPANSPIKKTSPPGTRAAIPGERSTVLSGMVKAESMVQLALALPLSTVIGWAIGDAIGKHFHTVWPAIVGLMLGAAAGFVQIIRIASKANRDTK